MDTNDPKWLEEFYPEGRTFYDESGDQQEFIRTMHALGLTVSVHYAPPEAELEPWATVIVPAKRLGEFYALNLRVGT
jgi:hypothetical protein